MSAVPSRFLQLLAFGVIAASLGACVGNPPTNPQVVAGPPMSIDPPTRTVVDPSLRPGVPDSMMRSDGTMMNGLLPMPPYY